MRPTQSILIALSLFLLLSGCHNRLQAQGQKMVPAPKQDSLGGYCLYSQATGPVDTPFMIAIWRGDIQRVNLLIASEGNLNKVFALSCADNKNLATTPLLNAIRGGHPEMVEFLLNHGANLLFRPSSDSSSSLSSAASAGNAVIVRILLKYGAPVDDRKRGGETALMAAAQRSKSIAVMKELIAANADIHAVDDFGNNALMLAAWQHQADAVKLLAELGIEPCLKNKEGKTALDMAVSYRYDEPGRREVISFLQAKCGG
jgi:ankyrin repeat protein